MLVSNPSGEAFRRSIFGGLTDHGLDTLLIVTYRLNQALVEWPNLQFYEGRMQPVVASASVRAIRREPSRVRS